jgi:hypothetical protein
VAATGRHPRDCRRRSVVADQTATSDPELRPAGLCDVAGGLGTTPLGEAAKLRAGCTHMTSICALTNLCVSDDRGAIVPKIGHADAAVSGVKVLLGR